MSGAGHEGGAGGRGGSSSRGASSSSRGRGRDGGGARGGRRRDFGGKLTAEGGKHSDRTDQGRERREGRANGADRQGASSTSSGKAKETINEQGSAHEPEEPQVKKLTTAPAPDAELCFICAEPVQLYSLPPCNHRTCHICAIRLRALYKKNECTFCKAPIETCVFTKDPTRDYLAFTAQDTPYRDERLSIFFETAEAKEEALILLRFNCPDVMCEYVGASWKDLKNHTRSEHNRFFCDLCLRHKRIFAHEHTLYSAAELTAHKRAEHPHCDFCHRFFYSDDEIYVHMRDSHEQCHICKKQDPSAFEYHRDYEALERHFRASHYQCENKACLEKKFVVFESEMDFKAHQVNEHGTELSSKEKRDALRVAANFTYESASSGASHREQNARRGGPSRRRGGAGEDESETRGTTDRDVLGISSLASRTHVPGAGPADHATRRAIFRAALTDDSSREAPQQQQQQQQQQQTDEQVVARHQAYMNRVSAIFGSSESKMASFRGSVKMFRGGEMSASDLVDSIHSLAGQDIDRMSPIINGLVDLLDDEDKKSAVRQAWNTLRVERTQFPSLMAGPSDGYSGAARGQIRNVKSNAASNNAVWASVERAASGRPAATSSASRLASRDFFPTLNSAPSGRSVPGSAQYAASANAAQQQHSLARGGITPWSLSIANAAPHSNPAASTRSIPSSAPGSSSGGGTKSLGASSTRSNAAAFPSLPSNAQAAALAAHKRQLLSKSKGRNPASGSSTPLTGGSGANTPNIWGSSGQGRIDGGGYDDEDMHQISDRLGDVALAQAVASEWGSGSRTAGSGEGGSSSTSGNSNKKKKPQKQVLVSMGGVHRG